MVETAEIKKGFQKTEVGIIPYDWGVFDITQIIKKTEGIKIGPFGSQLKKELLTTTGYKVYGQENVYVRNMEIGKRYIDKEHYNRLSSCTLLEGDFIISMMGTIGKCMIVPKLNEPGIMDSHLIRLRLDENKINSELLLHFFYSKILTNQVKKLSVGGIMEGLSSKIIKKIEIPLPPTKTEQTAIATALNDADKLIAELEKLISKKQKVKNIVHFNLVSGKKRIERFNGQWQEISIASLCKVFTKQTGFDYSAHIKPKLVKTFQSGVIPFIQNKDFSGQEINYDTDYYIPENVANNFPNILLDEKCLLISISGSIGNVGLFCNSKKAFLGGAIAVAKFINKAQLDWVLYYLQSHIGQDKLLKNMKSGAHHNLILEDIRKITIPIPNPEEQLSIVKIISELDSEIKSLQKKLDKYKMIKQGMMQNLLTGKIRLV